MKDRATTHTEPTAPKPESTAPESAPEATPAPLTPAERELRLVALADALLRAGGASEAEAALRALKLRINAAATPGPEGAALAALYDALLRADPRELAEVRRRIAEIAATERAQIDRADAH